MNDRIARLELYEGTSCAAADLPQAGQMKAVLAFGRGVIEVFTELAGNPGSEPYHYVVEYHFRDAPRSRDPMELLKYARSRANAECVTIFRACFANAQNAHSYAMELTLLT